MSRKRNNDAQRLADAVMAGSKTLRECLGKPNLLSMAIAVLDSMTDQAAAVFAGKQTEQTPKPRGRPRKQTNHEPEFARPPATPPGDVP